jgi:hypothetical protein
MFYITGKSYITICDFPVSRLKSSILVQENLAILETLNLVQPLESVNRPDQAAMQALVLLPRPLIPMKRLQVSDPFVRIHNFLFCCPMYTLGHSTPTDLC